MTFYEVLGQVVTMPVLVRDASAGAVIWDVDAGAVRALLPDAWEPIERSPGRAEFALVVVDHRDNDLGAHLEVGLPFFVRPAGGGPDGSFLRRLPMDQGFTRAAGPGDLGVPEVRGADHPHGRGGQQQVGAAGGRRARAAADAAQ